MGKAWIFGFIAVNIVLANIFVTKQFIIFGLTATGGNITYGAIFLATDMLCEHYSPAEGRKAVMLGFVAALFYLITSQFILMLKPAPTDLMHMSMRNIFSLAPRIIFASLCAYLFSQFHDVWFFHFLKQKTKGKFLWLRNNASTWISQLIDSIIFTTIAFWGIFTMNILIQIILSTYLLKIIVAFIDTPFIYLSYRFKPKELLNNSNI
jgi:uncharacterized integral membrane protein (TIGR00697 family)